MTVIKTIEQKVMQEQDLMIAKTILTDDLKERFDACVAFTLYQDIYDLFPSYINQVGNENYSELMKQKYIAVYHAVEQRLERWKAGTE